MLSTPRMIGSEHMLCSPSVTDSQKHTQWTSAENPVPAITPEPSCQDPPYGEHILHLGSALHASATRAKHAQVRNRGHAASVLKSECIGDATTELSGALVIL